MFPHSGLIGKTRPFFELLYRNENYTFCSFWLLQNKNKESLLYPRDTKYVEGYIVFVFLFVRPSFRPSGVNNLSQSFVGSFFIHQEMALGG